MFLIGLFCCSIVSAEPFLFIEQNILTVRVSYGKFYFDKKSGRDHHRQAVEYANGTTESFNFQNNHLEYQITRPGIDHEEIIYDEKLVKFVRKDFQENTHCELVQPADSWTTLTVDEASVSAPTIWHLYLANPELCKKHIPIILSRCKIYLDYEGIGDRILESVMKQSSNPDQLSFLDKATLVQDLGNDNYEVRKKAHEKLISIGPASIALIQSLSYKLDKEQSFRVKIIKRELGDASLDYEKRLPTWLVEDAWIWGHIYLNIESSRPLASIRIKELTGIAVSDEDIRIVTEICMTEKTHE